MGAEPGALSRCLPPGSLSRCLGGTVAVTGGGGGGVGGGAKYVVAVLEQFSFSLGSYTCKRIFLVHIITNNQQMANKLLHVLFPYKVSKITQH